MFIGLLLVPPVLLKLASTGYRFVRYYSGAPPTARRGRHDRCCACSLRCWWPARDHLHQRDLALAARPPARSRSSPLHKVAFIVWSGRLRRALPRLPPDCGADTRWLGRLEPRRAALRRLAGHGHARPQLAGRRPGARAHASDAHPRLARPLRRPERPPAGSAARGAADRTRGAPVPDGRGRGSRCRQVTSRARTARGSRAASACRGTARARARARPRPSQRRARVARAVRAPPRRTRRGRRGRRAAGR